MYIAASVVVTTNKPPHKLKPSTILIILLLAGCIRTSGMHVQLLKNFSVLSSSLNVSDVTHAVPKNVVHAELRTSAGPPSGQTNY